MGYEGTVFWEFGEQGGLQLQMMLTLSSGWPIEGLPFFPLRLIHDVVPGSVGLGACSVAISPHEGIILVIGLRGVIGRKAHAYSIVDVSLGLPD